MRANRAELTLEDANDVDVFMIMDDNFDMGSLAGAARLLFADHGSAQDHFGASVFWMQLEVREYLSLHPAELTETGA